MSDIKIMTGELYMKGLDGVPFKVGTAGELSASYDTDSDYFTVDETNDYTSHLAQGSMSLKLDRKFLTRRVWYKKKKGKRYVFTYRYESSLFYTNRRLIKRLRKWCKKLINLYTEAIMSEAIHGDNDFSGEGLVRNEK